MNRNSGSEAGVVMVTPMTQNIDLDQLIEERKQEKRIALKKELQEKLKTIRDRRKCGMNNEPFPQGDFQRLTSNGVWEGVFEYLTDPSDVTSVYFTCGTFAGIVRERRVLMWLPKVLNIFKEKVDEAYEIERKMGKRSYRNWHGICSNARLACKAWKKTVDFHVNIAKNNWVLTLEYIDEEPDELRTNVFIFRSSKSVAKAKFYVLNRGIPIRDVHVEVEDDTSEIYFNKLIEFFKAHGSSVRFLYFQYRILRNIGSRACERLFQVLKYVENLKKLDLIFFDGDHDDDDEDEIPEEQGEVVPEGFEEYPLPALDSLEYFSCGNWSSKESFVAQILKRCVNLRTVALLGGDIVEDATAEALMGLSLEDFHGYSTTIISYAVTWPLKRLGICQNWEPGSPPQEVKASVLFPAINRFRDTLEHLEIHLAAAVKMDATNVCLELLHLKSISIDSTRCGTLRLDDLLPLKSLEKISVTSFRYEDDNALVKVKRYLDSGEMHKSNVWQCFPNLGRFQENTDMRDSRATCYFRPTSSSLSGKDMRDK